MNTSNYLLAVVAGVSCALAGAAAAQESDADKDRVPGALQTVTITATRFEHDTRTAPASTTVITREELETRNATDLLDAVRGTAGITLTPRQVGGRKTLALRGLEGKHTLTLIDGRRISPSDDVVGHSDYQYGWLPMSAVERIEIVRGPMSTLYGSEALGGVINLITRQPKDHWLGSVGLSGSRLTTGDGDGDARGTLFLAGPLGDRLSVRLNAEASRSDAVAQPEDPRYSEIEGHEAKTLGLGASFELTANQRLEVNGTYGEEERFYDSVSRNITYTDHYDIERSQGLLAWRGEFDRWRAQARAYRSEMDITNARTNGIAPTRPQNLSDEVLDGFAAITLGKHSVTVGSELRKETLKNAGLLNGAGDAKHEALFVQDELALGGRTLLTAGVRADHHELFGTEISPRVYLVWDVNPDLVIKGGYGHAFKAPTLKQISPTYVGAEGPHTFLGNGNIKPEVSDSAELNVNWARGPLALRGTLFHTQVKDLITYRLLSVEGTRRTYLYDNVDQARINGLESGFTWTIVPGLTWNTDLTLLDTENKSTGTKLDDRPDSNLASHLDWSSKQAWSTRIGLERTGAQSSAGVNLPAYTLWNASVARRIGERLSLRLGVNNLTDVRLAEESPNFGYAERRRTVFAVLKAEL